MIQIALRSLSMINLIFLFKFYEKCPIRKKKYATMYVESWEMDLFHCHIRAKICDSIIPYYISIENDSIIFNG